MKAGLVLERRRNLRPLPSFSAEFTCETTVKIKAGTEPYGLCFMLRRRCSTRTILFWSTTVAPVCEVRALPYGDTLWDGDSLLSVFSHTFKCERRNRTDNDIFFFCYSDDFPSQLRCSTALTPGVFSNWSRTHVAPAAHLLAACSPEEGLPSAPRTHLHDLWAICRIWCSCRPWQDVPGWHSAPLHGGTAWACQSPL